MAEEWSVQQIRLSFFPVQALAPANPSTMWRDFVGSEPDVDEFQRAQGARRQVGVAFDLGSLELRITEGRIDWNLLPLAAPSESIPSVGRVSNVFPRIIEAVGKWAASQATSFTRVAFAPTFNREVENQDAGLAILETLIPSVSLKRDGRPPADFIFQVNRPRDSSAVKGMVFNRVMRWSQSSVNLLRIRVGDPSGLEQVNNSVITFDIDVNNAVGGAVPVRPLDSAALPAIFHEFGDLAFAAMLRGELA